MFTLRNYIKEAIGWAGGIFSLAAFALNSLNIIASQSVAYFAMNMIGCFFLIVYAVHKKAHASWVLNSVWLLMTLFACLKFYLAR